MLWREFHARLVVAIANHLQPRLDPRYVAWDCWNQFRSNHPELFPT